MAHIEYFREHGEWSPQDLRYGTPESMDELLRHTRTINRMAPGDVQFWEERRREQDERLRARQFELNAEPGINIPSWSPPVGPQNIPYRPPTGPRGLLAGLRMKAPTESGILGLTDFSDDYMSTRPADMPEMLSYTPSQRTGYPGVSQDYDDFSPVMGMLTDMAGDQPVYDEAVVTDMPSRSVFNRSQFTSDMPDVSQTLPEDTLRSMLDSRQPRAWGPVPSDGIVSIGTRQEEAASPDVIPGDASPAVTGQYGSTQNYGDFSPLMGTLVDTLNDPVRQQDISSPFGATFTKASTSSGFMPPGGGVSTKFGIPYSGVELANPNTSEMRSLDQQAAMMDKFNTSGMTIEEFSATQPSYTPGTGPSTVLGKQYHPGSFDTGTSGVVQHPQDFMTTTPTSSPADILAAAQVDTFRPVERLSMFGPSALTPGGVPVDDALPDPRFKSSIFDYLPSFISTASASDVVPTDFETYLADESWHGSNFGQVKTNVASKDFSNWASEQLRKADEVPVLPDFNTTMFDDIFTNQVPDPFATMEVKKAIVDDSFIGRMFADEEAAKNVETFVDIPAQPAPVVQTRRTTPTPVATPAITESDEMAMMVRDAVNRMAIRDQVRQDLLANRDRGGVSHAEVQAAINAMMGNEFGGMLGVGGLGRTMEDVGYGGGFASGRGDTGATGQGGWT